MFSFWLGKFLFYTNQLRKNAQFEYFAYKKQRYLYHQLMKKVQLGPVYGTFLALLKDMNYIPLIIKFKNLPGTHFYDVEGTKADAKFVSSDAEATLMLIVDLKTY